MCRRGKGYCWVGRGMGECRDMNERKVGHFWNLLNYRRRDQSHKWKPVAVGMITVWKGEPLVYESSVLAGGCRVYRDEVLYTMKTKSSVCHNVHVFDSLRNHTHIIEIHSQIWTSCQTMFMYMYNKFTMYMYKPVMCMWLRQMWQESIQHRDHHRAMFASLLFHLQDVSTPFEHSWVPTYTHDIQTPITVS